MIILPMRLVVLGLSSNLSFAFAFNLIYVLIYFLRKTLDGILDRPMSSRVAFRGKRANHEDESVYSETNQQQQW